MPDSFPVNGDTIIVDMIRKFTQERLAPLAAEREKAAKTPDRNEPIRHRRSLRLVVLNFIGQFWVKSAARSQRGNHGPPHGSPPSNRYLATSD